MDTSTLLTLLTVVTVQVQACGPQEDYNMNKELVVDIVLVIIACVSLYWVYSAV